MVKQKRMRKQHVVVVGGEMRDGAQSEKSSEPSDASGPPKFSHVFLLLLHQVATGALPPANIASPFEINFAKAPKLRNSDGRVG